MVHGYSPCLPATHASNQEGFDKPRENLMEEQESRLMGLLKAHVKHFSMGFKI